MDELECDELKEVVGQKVRGHSLSDAKIKEIIAEWKKTHIFVSPYSHGFRTDHLMALVSLGINKEWSLSEIRPVLKAIMSDELHFDVKYQTKWGRFLSREAGSSATDRILSNYKSFRRLCLHGGNNPYGKRLIQIGCCVDLFKEPVGNANNHAFLWYMRLNTHSTVPLLLEVLDRESIPVVDLLGNTSGPVGK